jgi:serine kinase of HPr protein (carbohydrate metabolism regulator)
MAEAIAAQMGNMSTEQVHASCVAIGHVGILLRGAVGAGKSDLALRLVDSGAVLVADDRVDLVAAGGRLTASAPATLAGKLEVRGLGVVAVPFLRRATVGLVVDLVAPDLIERVPEPRDCTVLGVRLPLLTVAPFETSASAKLRLAVRDVPRS